MPLISSIFVLYSGGIGRFLAGRPIVIREAVNYFYWPRSTRANTFQELTPVAQVTLCAMLGSSSRRFLWLIHDR